MKKFEPSEVEIRRLAEEDVIKTSLESDVTDDYFTEDNWWGANGNSEA